MKRPYPDCFGRVTPARVLVAPVGRPRLTRVSTEEAPPFEHASWGRRIGDLRFETEGAWKRGGTTVESLTKELKLALQYPEGAAV